MNKSEKLLKKYVTAGDFDNAQKAAGDLKRKLTKEELLGIIKKYVEPDEVEGIESYFINGNLTNEELEGFVKKWVFISQAPYSPESKLRIKGELLTWFLQTCMSRA